MNRKQRRAQEAQMRKISDDELSAKIAMFGKLPKECTACQSSFDETNREMVTTWNVVVRKEDEDNPVRLYCPTCWETAQEVVANFFKNMKVADK